MRNHDYFWCGNDQGGSFNDDDGHMIGIILLIIGILIIIVDILNSI